jgi:hypothetical protein
MESNNLSPASTTSNSRESDDAEDAQGQVSLAVGGGSVPSTSLQEGSTNVTTSAIGKSTIELNSSDSDSDDSFFANEIVDGKSDAEAYYAEKNNCLKILVAMCYGVTDEEGQPLIDIDESPWREIKRAQINPSSDHYFAEITRRHTHLTRLGRKIPRPRAKGWSIPNKQKWLVDNPIVSNADKKYLVGIVNIRKAAMEASNAETAEIDAQMLGNWVGKNPYLRLIHSIVDNDDIKGAFIHRNRISRGRLEIENQNHTESVWSKIADMWNNPQFMPVTENMTSVHSDFKADVIDHELVAHLAPATAEKVEKKWATVKNELTRIIANWEKSGQRDGGLDPDADNEHPTRRDGSFENRTAHAMESRAAFFANHNLYLLYIWILLERHQLLASTLQKLDDSVAAKDGTGSGLPSVFDPDDDEEDNISSTTSKVESEMGALSSSIADHGKSIENAARIKARSIENAATIEARNRCKEQLRSDILTLESEKLRLEAEKRELRIKSAVAKQEQNAVLDNLYTEMIGEIDAKLGNIDSKIGNHQDQIDRVHNDDETTPPRSNIISRKRASSLSLEDLFRNDK